MCEPVPPSATVSGRGGRLRGPKATASPGVSTAESGQGWATIRRASSLDARLRPKPQGAGPKMHNLKPNKFTTRFPERRVQPPLSTYAHGSPVSVSSNFSNSFYGVLPDFCSESSSETDSPSENPVILKKTRPQQPKKLRKHGFLFSGKKFGTSHDEKSP